MFGERKTWKQQQRTCLLFCCACMCIILVLVFATIYRCKRGIEILLPRPSRRRCLASFNTRRRVCVLRAMVMSSEHHHMRMQRRQSAT